MQSMVRPNKGYLSMSKHAQDACDALCLFLVPVALVSCALLQLPVSALLALIVAVVAVGLFLVGWERSKPCLRQILPTAVLVAAAVVGRIVFAAAPNIQPVTALCIIAGTSFGRRAGFMTGAMTGLVSSFFLGVGAWTPWQMYAWGLVGYIAGLLFSSQGTRATRGESGSIVAVLAFGFVGSFAFGLIMNTWAIIGFTASVSWESAVAVYGAGLVFDLAHAVSTVAFLGLLYVPLRRRLARISLRYGLAEANDAAPHDVYLQFANSSKLQ